jgi:hypothetical protein
MVYNDITHIYHIQRMNKDNLVDTESILENFNMTEMNTYFQTFMHNNSIIIASKLEY